MKSHLGWNELIPIAGCVLVLGVTGAALGSAVFGRQDLQGRARADLRSWVLAVNQYAQDNNGGLPLHGYAVGYGAPRRLEGWPTDGRLNSDDPCRNASGEFFFIPYARLLRFQDLFAGMHRWEASRDPMVQAPGCQPGPKWTITFRSGDHAESASGRSQALFAWMYGRIDWAPPVQGVGMEFAANRGLEMTREGQTK